MALKRKISKADYDKLSDELKKLYTENEDDENEFTLDLEGSDDTDPDRMRRARDREREKRKAAEKLLKEAEDKLSADDPDNPKNKDIKTLEASWKTKLEETQSALTGRISKAQQLVRKQMINSAAEAMAREISTSPKLMTEYIARRLTVEFPDDDDDEGEPTLKVLGADGKASTLSLPQLKKEIVADKEFSSIILASKGRGSGTPQNGSEKKPGSAGASEKTSDLSKLQGSDLVEALRGRKSEAQ